MFLQWAETYFTYVIDTQFSYAETQFYSADPQFSICLDSAFSAEMLLISCKTDQCSSNYIFDELSS